MINEYQAYQESIENIRTNYNTQYQVRVREEHGKVIDFIEYKRSQTDRRIESEIRDKVQSAYTIASHIYRLYKDEKSVTELRSMVAEVATARITKSVQHENCQRLVRDLQDRRDSVSGVSIDEEMISMTRSRNLYQGMLKYMGALDQMIGQLFELL